MSSYKEDLLRDLKDPEYAAGYLSAAIADSPESFLMALRLVAEAYKGMSGMANEAGVDRVNLYRMLSHSGNPRLNSLLAVLKVLPVTIRFEPKSEDNAVPR
ncbi:MAG TPA: hypothetical protein VIY49_02445 [Bryobacteraceae bacterium]